MSVIEKAKKYARLKIYIRLASVFASAAFLIAYQFVSPQFKGLAHGISPNPFIQIGIYASLFSIIFYLASLPLDFYASFIIEHKFSLSNQNFLGWLGDELKKGAISFFIFSTVIQFFYLILRLYPSNWWLWLSALWVLYAVILANITPTLILPLFYKYSPVESASLKDRIRGLANASGIRLLDVYKIDFSAKTKKANAAVIGLGGTRRVILADNLLTDFEEREIASVVAHEFGHHKKRHMARHIIFGSLASTLGFFVMFLVSSRVVRLMGAGAVYDIVIFPSILLLFLMYDIVLTPLSNLYSRVLERDADAFALRITGDPAGFISMMERLAEKNLADAAPPALVKIFFYDHPPIGERIEFAKNFKVIVEKVQ